MESRNTDANINVFKSVDWITILLYLLLVIGGAISIYAASYDFDKASMFDFSEFSGKQFMWIALSLMIGACILLLDYRLYEAYAYPIYGAVVLLLLVTIVIAPDIKGSRSWLVLGPVSLQPAEFGKFATALALAKLFDSYNFVLNQKLSNYYRALIIIFIPIICILLQKETGSALVYFSLIFVLYREGMSGFILFAMMCAVVFFVVSVKFSSPILLGLPAGEFAVFVMILVVFSLLLFFYCRDVIIARNVILFYSCVGIIAAVLSYFGVNIP